MKSLLLGNPGESRAAEGKFSFGLITQRSKVQILPPQPHRFRRISYLRSIQPTCLLLLLANAALANSFSDSSLRWDEPLWAVVGGDDTREPATAPGIIGAIC
jgi:hypothetical protein